MVCGGSYLFLAIASGSWIAPLIAMTILGAIVLGFFWIIENWLKENSLLIFARQPAILLTWNLQTKTSKSVFSAQAMWFARLIGRQPVFIARKNWKKRLTGIVEATKKTFFLMDLFGRTVCNPLILGAPFETLAGSSPLGQWFERMKGRMDKIKKITSVLCFGAVFAALFVFVWVAIGLYPAILTVGAAGMFVGSILFAPD